MLCYEQPACVLEAGRVVAIVMKQSLPEAQQLWTAALICAGSMQCISMPRAARRICAAAGHVNSQHRAPDMQRVSMPLGMPTCLHISPCMIAPVKGDIRVMSLGI